MNPDKFNHALALTRCRGKSAEAARLHLVAGLTIDEAARKVGIARPTASRTVNTIINKIEGVKMSAKKLGIYLADDSLSFLSVIQNKHGEKDDMNLSSAVNLTVQFSKLVSSEPLPLTPGEILLCCDVLNGGATLTEFDTPDSVSIRRALDSMRFGLLDARYHEDGIFEKWDVVESEFYDAIRALSTSELFALAIATRQFWSNSQVSDKKPLNECSGYQTWAKQWVI